MQFLLDTHTFIWFINGDSSLPENVLNNIRNINNRCFISIASIWEMAIKMSLGKLELKAEFDKILDILDENDFEILPITFNHIQTLINLPYHHRDPFDRIILISGNIRQLNCLN